jgi:hypothetical protein
MIQLPYNKAAEEAVRNRFPEFPPALTAELEKPRAVIALAEGPGEMVAIEDPVSSSLGPVKDMVYDYLRKRNGNLSIDWSVNKYIANNWHLASE